MKEKFEELQLEILDLEDDVITSSGCGGGMTGCGNETPPAEL